MGRLVSVEEWERRREVMERLAGSGLSMAEFTRREGISYAQLLAWRARFAPKNDSARVATSSGGAEFAELVVEHRTASAVALNTAVEIAVPSGVILRLYNGDDEAPYTLFEFNESRGAESPKAMLDSYTGWLMSDGYGVYPSVNHSIQRGGGAGFRQAICWAHARRGFVDALKLGDTRAKPIIELIGSLYGVEREAAGLDPPERLARRQQDSLPILSQIREWLDDNTQITALGKTALGKAVGYALNQWEELCVYTTDGRLPIDNNAVERSIRPATLGRKNGLFAGSPRGAHAAAVFLTLIDSAKRAGLNTWEYFHDLIARIADHPINQIDELLPNNWKPAASKQP